MVIENGFICDFEFVEIDVFVDCIEFNYMVVKQYYNRVGWDYEMLCNFIEIQDVFDWMY